MNAFDSGHTNFLLTYDASTSTIRGAGKDNAGTFTIDGTFDGQNVRWMKRYSTWEWVYVGKAIVAPDASEKHGNPDDVDASLKKSASTNASYQFVGSWGKDEQSFSGTFELSATRQDNLDALIAGEWTGTHHYNDDPRRADAPMKLVLVVLPNRGLRGEGEDQGGAFTVDGRVDGTKVHMQKTYALDSGTTCVYDGHICGIDTIAGTWGSEKTVKGTFTINNGATIPAGLSSLERTEQLWAQSSAPQASSSANGPSWLRETLSGFWRSVFPGRGPNTTDRKY